MLFTWMATAEYLYWILHFFRNHKCFTYIFWNTLHNHAHNTPNRIIIKSQMLYHCTIFAGSINWREVLVKHFILRHFLYAMRAYKSCFAQYSLHILCFFVFEYFCIHGKWKSDKRQKRKNINASNATLNSV